MEHQESYPKRQATTIREYLISEMTYDLCPTGVPTSMFELNIGAPLMVLRGAIHYKVVNGNIFILKRYKKGFVCGVRSHGIQR